MKKVRDILFILVAVVGLTMTAPAQKNDQKRPPKNPPVITPQDKNRPKGDKPKNNDKGRGEGKKPGMAFAGLQQDVMNS